MITDNEEHSEEGSVVQRTAQEEKKAMLQSKKRTDTAHQSKEARKDEGQMQVFHRALAAANEAGRREIPDRDWTRKCLEKLMGVWIDRDYKRYDEMWNSAQIYMWLNAEHRKMMGVFDKEWNGTKKPTVPLYPQLRLFNVGSDEKEKIAKEKPQSDSQPKLLFDGFDVVWIEGKKQECQKKIKTVLTTVKDEGLTEAMEWVWQVLLCKMIAETWIDAQQIAHQKQWSDRQKKTWIGRQLWKKGVELIEARLNAESEVPTSAEMIEESGNEPKKIRNQLELYYFKEKNWQCQHQAGEGFREESPIMQMKNQLRLRDKVEWAQHARMEEQAGSGERLLSLSKWVAPVSPLGNNRKNGMPTRRSYRRPCSFVPAQLQPLVENQNDRVEKIPESNVDKQDARRQLVRRRDITNPLLLTNKTVKGTFENAHHVFCIPSFNKK